MKRRRQRSSFPRSIVLPSLKEPTIWDKVLAGLSLVLVGLIAPLTLLFRQRCCTCQKKIGRWDYLTTATSISKTMLVQCIDCRKAGRPISGARLSLFRW